MYGSTRGSLGVLAVVVVGPEFSVRRGVGEHMVGGDEQRVRDGNDRLFVAAMAEDAPVTRSEGAVSRPRRSKRGLDQGGAEPPVSAARGAGVALARALMVSRAEARPAR